MASLARFKWLNNLLRKNILGSTIFSQIASKVSKLSKRALCDGILTTTDKKRVALLTS
jgi:hypothetical protein